MLDPTVWSLIKDAAGELHDLLTGPWVPIPDRGDNTPDSCQYVINHINYVDHLLQRLELAMTGRIPGG